MPEADDLTVRKESSKAGSITGGKTICGKKLKCGTLSPILMTSDAGAIRTKLADLQNSGREVCGVCASHFYEDDLP